MNAKRIPESELEPKSQRAKELELQRARTRAIVRIIAEGSKSERAELG
jgi:hypothetical protein